MLHLLVALALTACNSGEAPEYTPTFSPRSTSTEAVYVFGVHPLHNPQRLHEVFGPLMAYLSEHVDDARFRLEASRNYAAYDEKLYARQFHFALPNPYQTVNAVKQGYRVFGKMGDDHNFRGIILVRKDSGIHEVTDLRGKAVSYPAPTALAATMLPQHYLNSHGLDVMHEVENRYVGSQESSIMNVYLGDVAAGATWPPPWRALSRERPELAEALEVKWQTESLPNNGLVVLPEVPVAVVNRVSDLLFGLHEIDSGRAILARMELSRFEAADDATYDSVREFIVRFSREVRPVE
ncbi:MAG: phosphate/phosphite/phosphonate ABC transporter substrate-binding protein [Ectothiorhodospiraceae bacterium]|nr:phosphate/phosphite/phosphonate ABC transporter substrate-binding protein [Ectothiorhodospiraceae bacterium]